MIFINAMLSTPFWITFTRDLGLKYPTWSPLISHLNISGLLDVFKSRPDIYFIRRLGTTVVVACKQLSSSVWDPSLFVSFFTVLPLPLLSWINYKVMFYKYSDHIIPNTRSWRENHWKLTLKLSQQISYKRYALTVKLIGLNRSIIIFRQEATSAIARSNQNLEVLVCVEGGKPENPEKNTGSKPRTSS